MKQMNFPSLSLLIFPPYTQVLEYEPGPPGRWVLIGRLRTKRADHALITVGPEDLPCLDEKNTDQ